MVTTGGEVAFVSRMVDESLRLREQVKWYTTMLGKLSSVSTIVEKLMLEHGNHNVAVTEFVQGSKTRRWAVAWSWGDLRPAMVLTQLTSTTIFQLTSSRTWQGAFPASRNIFFPSRQSTRSI